MPLSDAKHPIWPIVRMAVMFAGAALILHETATSFDSGEMMAAGGVGAASLAFDLIKRTISS
jgi:hypothetical protein